MKDGIYTLPHYLYKSNIADNETIKETRKDNSLKILCEYKTELIILFDDFFRSQQLPKISPALHFLFQQTNLIDAHFYRCKVQEHTIQLSFLKDKNITLLVMLPTY